MKRQSIAETTLKKQIKNIDTQIDALNEEADRLGIRLSALHNFRDDLEAECEALYQARLTASEKAECASSPSSPSSSS